MNRQQGAGKTGTNDRNPSFRGGRLRLLIR
jgi:hypothetical protein